MKDLTLSVIIPTYNRSSKLKTCLEALQRQSLQQALYEVIVVNDGSPDDTAKLLAQMSDSWPELKVLHQKNSGQGVARNQALKIAKGQVVLFIGDDIYATHEFLERHLNFHKKNPDSQMACLGLTEWDPEHEVTPYMEWLTHGGPQFAYHQLKEGQAADFWYFYTSNLSLKKRLLEEKAFDTDFSGYGWEDIELGYRLMQKGLQLIYNPDALAFHDHFLAESDLETKMKKIYESAPIFQKKHPDVQVTPQGVKRRIFWLLSNPICLLVLWCLRKLFPRIMGPWYWYALSKRYTLKYT